MAKSWEGRLSSGSGGEAVEERRKKRCCLNGLILAVSFLIIKTTPLRRGGRTWRRDEFRGLLEVEKFFQRGMGLRVLRV